MPYPRVIGLFALAAMLAGCGNDSDHTSTNFIGLGSSSLVNGGITVHDNQVTLHARSAPNAVINAAGELSIDGKPVAINAAQRALLQDYHRNALAVREHGIATGKAGVAIAGQAISSVAKGLASGDTDNIDKQIDAKSKNVEQEARKICTDLAGVKVAQDSLATQLPAFKPYAGIVDASSVSDCSDHSSN